MLFDLRTNLNTRSDKHSGFFCVLVVSELLLGAIFGDMTCVFIAVKAFNSTLTVSIISVVVLVVLIPHVSCKLSLAATLRCLVTLIATVAAVTLELRNHR